MIDTYRDRREAGLILARRLESLGVRPGTIVLALPRGGVEIAHAVARRLGLELDVLLVRKLGVPGHEELAMGAIASGGRVTRNLDVIETLDVAPEDFERVRQAEARELTRRERAYRSDRPYPDLAGRDVLVVDDGLATGATMRAAVAAVRDRNPRRILVAAPVASASARDLLEAVADLCVFDQVPEPFRAVGVWYDSFPQVTDEQVRDWLTRSRDGTAEPETAPDVG